MNTEHASPRRDPAEHCWCGRALLRRQRGDGHWVFELEADATIPAEYVLLEHYMDRITPDRQAKIGVYLRRIQGEHGGWPMFHAGAFDLSASVKAYCALKAIGDDPQAPHMIRARQAILVMVARNAPMSSRAFSLPYSEQSLGAACRSCRSRSCTCPSGSSSTSGRCRTGHAPASSRSSSYKPCIREHATAGAELR